MNVDTDILPALTISAPGGKASTVGLMIPPRAEVPRQHDWLIRPGRKGSDSWFSDSARGGKARTVSLVIPPGAERLR